jgi:hypothetical protein
MSITSCVENLALPALEDVECPFCVVIGLVMLYVMVRRICTVDV